MIDDSNVYTILYLLLLLLKSRYPLLESIKSSTGAENGNQKWINLCCFSINWTYCLTALMRLMIYRVLWAITEDVWSQWRERTASLSLAISASASNTRRCQWTSQRFSKWDRICTWAWLDLPQMSRLCKYNWRRTTNNTFVELIHLYFLKMFSIILWFDRVQKPAFEVPFELVRAAREQTRQTKDIFQYGIQSALWEKVLAFVFDVVHFESICFCI